MEDEKQATYLLTVRAEPGVDAVRSLRTLLKAMLRTYGLRCMEIQEVKQQRRTNMDMRKFGTGFIKPEDVRENPIRARIVIVLEELDKYGQPVIELDTGAQFSLNRTNNDILLRAWGYDSKNWPDQEIEFFHGTYRDRETDAEKETVKVRPISPAKSATSNNSGTENKPPLPAPMSRPAPLAMDLDDEVPFVLAFFIVGAVAWLIAGGSTLIA